MTYEIAYTCENENMCEIKRVVILIHSRTLERLKRSYYTDKPSIYHEGKFIVWNYAEDQAGMDIRKEDVEQARNGMYYTSQEIETWKVKNTQDLPTYGNCERCCRSGPIGTECSQCEERPLIDGGGGPRAQLGQSINLCKGNLRITYCPTDDMTADYMMKPLQGEKFRKF